jgi:hypothetical protein
VKPAAPAPAPCYAVALFPGEAGAVREVRVLIVDMFGAPSLADAIGAAVREVDGSGVPLCKPWDFIPVQRLIAARLDEATGRRSVPARELAEKRDAYAARLAAGPASRAWPMRRKPRLVDAPETTRPDPRVENDAASCEPSPEELGWLAEHEREQEAA